MGKSNREQTCALLLVGNDPQFRRSAAEHFRRRGYRVKEADDGKQARQHTVRLAFDVAIVDMGMPNISGIELLKQIQDDSDCEVILLTEQGTIERAVAAMKLGAFDFLAKPVRLSRLEAVVEQAVQLARLCQQNRPWRAVDEGTQPRSHMIGQSPAMQEVYRLIERAGPANKPILIQGESGTGKELVAKALHQTSPRSNQPMVVINCAALPDTLLESELFGHEKGSFTGATSAKAGLFEIADGGTLFIDEIGEMPGALQAKLLRVLEDGSLRRVGAVKEQRVNVRLLTATNRDLVQEVKHGRFREDLYYRIDVMRLELPPLRDRGDDIALLAHYFAGDDWTIDAAALRAIQRFAWPGNVRQLNNAIERAKILADDHTILLPNLPSEVAARESTDDEHWQTDDFHLDSVKRRQVEVVMSRERGNKVRAARALGVSRRGLYRLLDKYEIAAG